MLVRRLEWLIYGFCTRGDTGYSFSKKRLQDFKVQMGQYLGEPSSDPNPYLRSDVCQIVWTFLQTNDIDGSYWFVQCQSIRWVLVGRSGCVSKTEKSCYYPRSLKRFPVVCMSTYAEVTQHEGNTPSLNVCTYQKIIRSEIRELKNPFEAKQRLASKKIGETSCQMKSPEKLPNKKSRFTITFDNYLEIGVKDFSKFFAQFYSFKSGYFEYTTTSDKQGKLVLWKM